MLNSILFKVRRNELDIFNTFWALKKCREGCTLYPPRSAEKVNVLESSCIHFWALSDISSSNSSMPQKLYCLTNLQCLTRINQTVLNFLCPRILQALYIRSIKKENETIYSKQQSEEQCKIFFHFEKLLYYQSKIWNSNLIIGL